MTTKIFVNLPVKDLDRSTEFFTGLGFSFDQRFSDDNAGCLVNGYPPAPGQETAKPGDEPDQTARTERKAA